MHEKLNDGYTLYFSYDREGKVRGGYLKKTDQGLCPSGLEIEEEMFLNAFPTVLDLLKSGKTLQMCRGEIGYMFIAMLGKESYEGPYAETECFDQVIVAYHSSPFLALHELECALVNSNELGKGFEYKKAYRFYGSDKYELCTKSMEGDK